jgi:hypothetical protein
MRFPRWITIRSSRWPTTAEGWAEGEEEVSRRIRTAAIEVAEEIGEFGLADEMRAQGEVLFPAAEYLQELNKRSKNAGNRAYRLAVRRRTRG